MKERKRAALLTGAVMWLAACVSVMASPVPAVPLVAANAESGTGVLPTPQFRRYSTAEGLPSTSIYAVAQDHSGAIWFGTRSGIARLDGVNFQVFRHADNDPGSLYDNGIASLLVDRQGRLWAGGLSAGLNRYDAPTGRFVHWGHDPVDPDSLASDRVWAIAQTADGALWVGTSNGLDRMRADERGFEHVRNPMLGNSPTDFGTVGALYVDPHQRLWIGSEHGVFRRDPDGKMQRVLPANPLQPMDAWRIDGEGDEVRIATVNGLLVVGKDGLAHRFGGEAIPDTNVMTSVRDTAGRLWIGTQQGLFLQQRPGGPVTAVTNQPMLYGDLPGSWVEQILCDREGGLWLALRDGGVAYLAPGWNDFSRFTHVPDDPDSLRDTVATAMARSSDGQHVWVGERAGRVDRLDPASGTVDHVLSGLGGEVGGMTEDARHRLWIAVQGALYVYDYAHDRLTRVDPHGYGMRRPLEVEPGPDGQMYARTFGDGLYRIDPDTLMVSRVPMDQPDEKVRWGSQMTLHAGTFWYASAGGMMRLNATQDRFEMVPGMPAGHSVDAFWFTAKGLWTANTDGLTHYRQDGDGLALDRTVDAAHGWPAINVTDLCVDAEGRVWIFGSDGLWRFDPADGKFRSFGLQDGLANGEFSRGYAKMPDGYIYAPTMGGVVAFDPDRIHEQTTVPPLSITGVSVLRHGSLQKLPIRNDVLEVGWQDRQLAIEARVFSYANPAANHYRFLLRGLDNDWVDTDNRGSRDFSGLGSGHYSLYVMAAGANDVWAHLAVPLHIHVEAPPWTRWWAWLGYLLGGVLLAFLGLRGWQRRLAHRHQIQLAEQRRQLAEQASAAKTQFLATLSHEIRTPMTGVMGMAELLLDTPLNATQQGYAETMQRSGGMLLKLLNDALDLARIEAGRLELESAPFDPRAMMEEVGRLALGQASAKELEFAVRVADDLPARVVGDAFRIHQILLNLVNNALKFTERGSVILAASRCAEELVFSVSDTGPGIPEAVQARLFEPFEQGAGPQRRTGSGLGLAICRELTGLMGGQIELESRMGCGSTFRFRIALPEVAVPSPPVVSMASVAAGEGHPCRVLLVEDDAIVAEVVVRLLERQGHQVRHAANGLEALAELAQASCDVMLLDLDLPGVDGFQVAQLVRQHEKPGEHLPIIAITARTGGDEEARSRAAGMDRFLRKPLTGEQLARMLVEVAGYAADDAVTTV
jgi:signal transduction histidine kinase/ligand-binding sensor domain-containing protein/ActR/RegA family two-component response regulator